MHAMAKLNREDALAKIQSIVRDHLDSRDLNLAFDTKVADLEEWDSVANVQINIAVETLFGIRFRPAEFIGFETVGELVDCVCAKLAAAFS